MTQPLDGQVPVWSDSIGGLAYTSGADVRDPAVSAPALAVTAPTLTAEWVTLPAFTSEFRKQRIALDLALVFQADCVVVGLVDLRLVVDGVAGATLALTSADTAIDHSDSVAIAVNRLTTRHTVLVQARKTSGAPGSATLALADALLEGVFITDVPDGIEADIAGLVDIYEPIGGGEDAVAAHAADYEVTGAVAAAASDYEVAGAVAAAASDYDPAGAAADAVLGLGFAVETWDANSAFNVNTVVHGIEGDTTLYVAHTAVPAAIEPATNDDPATDYVGSSVYWTLFLEAGSPGLGFTYRGPWSGESAYGLSNEVVLYTDGALYIGVGAPNTNHAPGDTDYWALFVPAATDGADGLFSVPLSNIPAIDTPTGDAETTLNALLISLKAEGLMAADA